MAPICSFKSPAQKLRRYKQRKGRAGKKPSRERARIYIRHQLEGLPEIKQAPMISSIMGAPYCLLYRPHPSQFYLSGHPAFIRIPRRSVPVSSDVAP